ncbi:MAG TPA: hypothetical protein VLL75_20640 [Vicinamibacteria bacterium]|jgi:hypothetical protein|nr:hypothetical protein [Vicinamibacteria bacterium]
MRVFWAGFLLTGLVLVGLSTFEAGRTSVEAQTSLDVQTSEPAPAPEETFIVSALEDGTPMPPPRPKK